MKQIIRQENKKTKNTKAIVLLLLLFILLLAIMSFKIDALFNLGFNAEAALPVWIHDDSRYNLTYSYGRINAAPVQVLAVNTLYEQSNMSVGTSAGSLSAYMAGASEMVDGGVPKAGFEATKPATNYTYVVYVRFQLSEEIQNAMNAGNISSIEVQADTASVRQPSFIYNTGEMHVRGFVTLIPKNVNLDLFNASVSEYISLRADPKHSIDSPNTTAMTKGATASKSFWGDSNKVVISRDVYGTRLTGKGEVVVGYIMQMRKKQTGTFGMAGQNPQLEAYLFKNARLKVNYDPPTVRMTAIGQELQQKGITYAASGTVVDAYDKITSPDGHSLQLSDVITISIVTSWNTDFATGNEFVLFDKFNYNYQGSSTNPYVAAAKKPPHGRGVLSITFGSHNTTVGTHTFNIETVLARVVLSESGSNSFSYMQDENNNYKSVGVGPQIQVREDDTWKKIIPSPEAGISNVTNRFKLKSNSGPFFDLNDSSKKFSSEPSYAGSFTLKANITYVGAVAATLLNQETTINFNILPIYLTEVMVAPDYLQSLDLTYNGRPHTPVPESVPFTYTYSLGGQDVTRSYLMRLGTDYLEPEITYARNINAYTGIFGSAGPSLKIKGIGNFSSSKDLYFRIKRLNITGNVIAQIGERQGESISAGFKPFAQEITAFHNTQIYDRDINSNNFPKPEVSYLRFGWHNDQINQTTKNGLQQRFYLINQIEYAKHCVSAPFNEEATYGGNTYPAYRTISAANENATTNPDESQNWVVASTYKIKYDSYRQIQDNATKKIYGFFTIQIDNNQNFLGQVELKYEISPRNLNAATVYVSKSSIGRIYNDSNIAQTVFPNEIKIYDTVNVWSEILEDDTIIGYNVLSQARVYTIAKRSSLSQSSTGYQGVYDDSTGITLGTNRYTRDNLVPDIEDFTIIDGEGVIEFGDAYLNPFAAPSGGGNYMEFTLLHASNEQDQSIGTYLLNFMYQGKLRLHFEISPKAFSDSTTINTQYMQKPADVVYNSSIQDIPLPEVRDQGKLLQLGTDYQLSYRNNQDVAFDENGDVISAAVVTVTGVGNYTSSIEASFMIARREVKSEYLAAINLPAVKYTGQKIIPTVEEFDITFISSTIPAQSGYQYDMTAPLQSKTFTISNIIRSADPDDPTYDPSWPNGNLLSQFRVLEGDENTGINQSAGTADNWVMIEIIAGNFRGRVKASFEITQRDISELDSGIIGHASWATMEVYKPYVTYSGSRISNIAIVANNPNNALNTIVLMDKLGGLSKTLIYGSASDDCDFYITPNSWGTNVNAGDGILRDHLGNGVPLLDGNGNTIVDAEGNTIYMEDVNTGGRLTVYGKGNYTGSYTIKFRILARDIQKASDYKIERDESEEAGYIRALSGYKYTGSPITPAILSIQNLSFSGTPFLVESQDYIIDYEDFDVDPNNNGYNVSVLKGGKISIIGKGNYSGKQILRFKIVPREQNVNLLIQESSANETLKIETKATGRADFEINADNPGYIIVQGRTSAIYPSGRRVNFVVTNPQTGALSDLVIHNSIVYQSVVVENGYSITTAQIPFVPKKYGVIRIIAEQYDGEGVLSERIPAGTVGGATYYIYGNYKTVSQDAGSIVESKRIYLKRQDSASGLVNIERTYGDPNTTIRHNLESRAFGNNNFSFSLDTSNFLTFDSFVEGSESFVMRIQNAGSTSITISHDGYIHPEQIDRAYVSYSKTITFNIRPRELFVMFGGFYRDTTIDGVTTREVYQDVEYGFNYTGGRFATNKGIQLYPLYKYVTRTYEQGLPRIVDGLAYQDRINKDKPEDVYSSNLAVEFLSEIPNVGNHLVRVETADAIGGEKIDNYHVVNRAPEASNYMIGTIEVTKKLLTPYVKLRVDDIEVNQLEKIYGEEDNPNKYKVDYRGFITGENYSSISVNSEIEYAYKTEGTKGPHSETNIHLDVNASGYDEANEYMVEQFSDVGTYIIRLKEGLADNYEIPRTKLYYVINKASVEILFGFETPQNYRMQINYSGNSVDLSMPDYFNQANIIAKGLDNGSIPIESDIRGRFSFKYVHDGDLAELDRAPSKAGIHEVTITFTADINDNYKNTTTKISKTGKIFILEILRVRPIITMERREIQFKDAPIELSDLGFGARVFPIPGGDPPFPDIIVANNYEFKAHGASSTFYTRTWPSAMGKYDVRISYEADSNSNYSDLEIEFDGEYGQDENGNPVLLHEGIIEITPKDVYITAQEREVEFRAQQTPYPTNLIKGLESIAQGAQELQGNITITYIKDGAETTLYPTNAGIYDIRVDFDPTNQNYRKTTRVFERLYEIKKFDLYESNKDTALKYDINNPNRVKTVDYNGKSQAFSLQEIELSKLENDNNIVPGSRILIQYVPFGQASYVAHPKESGIYKLVIRYIPADNDNYVMAQSIEYNNILVINRINPIVPHFEPRRLDFTGQGIGISVRLEGITYVDGGITKTDILKGTMEYEYKSTGAEESEYSSTLPIVPGTYDIKIKYTGGAVDNYKDYSTEVASALIIEKVQPTLSLDSSTNTITIDYATPINVRIKALGRGQYLPKTADGSAISIQYKDLEGAVIISPEESGTYEIYASYIAPADESIYTSVSLRLVGTLIIRNVKPVLSLENTDVIYNGMPIQTKQAVIENLEGREAKGTLVYRYRKTTDIEYSLSVPFMAGDYDVQVEYRENQTSDNFSSVTFFFPSAIKIRVLDIEVESLYGQGKTFDGQRADDSSLLYFYSYNDNGINRYVYSEAQNSRNEKYDLSKALFYSDNGYAYVIDTASKMAFADYKSYKIEQNSYSFTYVPKVLTGSQTIYYDTVSANENLVYQAYGANSRNLFIIDTINMVAYTQNETLDYYEVSEVNGYFFNILNSAGIAHTISINVADIRANGDYKVVIDGFERTFKIDLNDLTAKTQNLQTTYQIYKKAGEIKKPIINSNGAFASLYFDYKNLVKGNSASPMFMFFASDGFIYNILPSKNTTKRMFRLNVESSQFIDIDSSPNPINFALSDLTSLYGQNIYTITANGKTYTLDLAQGYARTNNAIQYIELSEYQILIDNISISLDDPNFTPMPYDSLYQYVVDENNIYVINMKNKNFYHKSDVGQLNTNTNKIEFSDATRNVNVDFKSLVYKLYKGTNLANEDTLFNKKLRVKSPILLNTNDRFASGEIYVSYSNAGTHNINIDGMRAGANYNVTTTSITKYHIDKAVVFIIFTQQGSIVYDSSVKTVGFEYLGVVETETISNSQSEISYQGDRINATLDGEEGFRLNVILNNPNYFIMRNSSPWYKIEKAEFPTYTQSEKVVTYTGDTQALVVTGLDATYVFEYEGYDNEPRFSEPGTYVVKAIISKLNHKAQKLIISMTINKALFTVEPDPINTTLYFGSNMPELKSSSTLGKFVFADGQVLDPNVKTYQWRFVPEDRELFYSRYEGLPENNYIVKGTIDLHVEKSPATISLKGPLTQNLKSPESLIPIIDGVAIASDKVIVTYYAADGEMFTKMPAREGTYTVVVKYLGDANHAPTEYRTELYIKDPGNFNWLWISLGAIVGLGLLSSLYFLLRKKKTYK